MNIMGKHLIIMLFLITVVCTTSCKSRGDYRALTQFSPMEYCNQDKLPWSQWFETNHEVFLYTYGAISANHESAINDLLTLYFRGSADQRKNCHMIYWRLSKFYPVSVKANNERLFYNNLEMQIDSLLNFEVDIYEGYEARRKSALMRMMAEFKVELYFTKLMNKYRDTMVQSLIESEQTAWSKYFKSATKTFEKLVLHKSSYYLKPVFWANYELDLLEQRLAALMSMYFEDKSIWGYDDSCRWDEVSYVYDNITPKLNKSPYSENQFSYEEQKSSLETEEEHFKAYINARWNVSQKVGFYDENCILHYKEESLERIFDTYNKPEAIVKQFWRIIPKNI